jgi:hypothetical protein
MDGISTETHTVYQAARLIDAVLFRMPNARKTLEVRRVTTEIVGFFGGFSDE